MLLLHKDLTFKVEKVSDAGIFEGYASVFGVKDSYGDMVVKGAFEQSIKTRKPKVLWQHRSAEPVGVPIITQEDQHGLFVQGQLALKTVRGMETQELLKMGVIEGLSIGYFTLIEEWNEKEQTNYLKELDLWEYSFVTFPANDKASITSIKSLESIDSLSDAENFLRESGGFSKQQAVGIVSIIKNLARSESDVLAELNAISERACNAMSIK